MAHAGASTCSVRCRSRWPTRSATIRTDPMPAMVTTEWLDTIPAEVIDTSSARRSPSRASCRWCCSPRSATPAAPSVPTPIYSANDRGRSGEFLLEIGGLAMTAEVGRGAARCAADGRARARPVRHRRRRTSTSPRAPSSSSAPTRAYSRRVICPPAGREGRRRQRRPLLPRLRRDATLIRSPSFASLSSAPWGGRQQPAHRCGMTGEGGISLV